MHPVPQRLLYFFSADFVFSRMFHSSKQSDAVNLRLLASGRSIYSAHEVLKYSDSCSRKQLHVKVYKYLQVQYEINETSQTSLHQCKKKRKRKNMNKEQVKKRVGMKVHRYNPLCTLLNDVALTMESHEGQR